MFRPQDALNIGTLGGRNIRTHDELVIGHVMTNFSDSRYYLHHLHPDILVKTPVNFIGKLWSIHSLRFGRN